MKEAIFDVGCHLCFQIRLKLLYMLPFDNKRQNGEKRLRGVLIDVKVECDGNLQWRCFMEAASLLSSILGVWCDLLVPKIVKFYTLVSLTLIY